MSQAERTHLEWLSFIYHYINEHDPYLLLEAVKAFDNQHVTAESAATGGE